MSAEHVAVRYAGALIEALAEKDALDQAEQFLQFAALVADNAELNAAFASVTIPLEDKVKVVTALGEKAGLPPMIGNLLRVMGQNGRLGIMRETAAAVRTKLDARRGVKAVRLTTAADLSAEAAASFSDAMKKQLGTEVRVEHHTDPDILGGAVAQVGSIVYDGSVRAQLQRMRRELIKEN